MKTIALVTLLSIGALAIAACAHLKPVITDCAAQLAGNVLADVSAALNADKAALEALAVKYGLEAVECAVSHLLTDEVATPTIGPNRRVQVGREFMKDHGF